MDYIYFRSKVNVAQLSLCYSEALFRQQIQQSSLSSAFLSSNSPAWLQLKRSDSSFKPVFPIDLIEQEHIKEMCLLFLLFNLTPCKTLFWVSIKLWKVYGLSEDFCRAPTEKFRLGSPRLTWMRT